MVWRGIFGYVGHLLDYMAYGSAAHQNRNWITRKDHDRIVRKEYGHGKSDGINRGNAARKELESRLEETRKLFPRSILLKPGYGSEEQPSNEPPEPNYQALADLTEINRRLQGNNQSLEERLFRALDTISARDTEIEQLRPRQPDSIRQLSPPQSEMGTSFETSGYLGDEIVKFYEGKKVVLLGPVMRTSRRIGDHFGQNGIHIMLVPKDKLRRYQSASNNADLVILGLTVNHKITGYLNSHGIPWKFIGSTSESRIAEALVEFYQKNTQDQPKNSSRSSFSSSNRSGSSSA